MEASLTVSFRTQTCLLLDLGMPQLQIEQSSAHRAGDHTHLGFHGFVGYLLSPLLQAPSLWGHPAQFWFGGTLSSYYSGPGSLSLLMKTSPDSLVLRFFFFKSARYAVVLDWVRKTRKETASAQKF